MSRVPGFAPLSRPVFAGTAVIILGYALWAMLWPQAADAAIFGSMAWIAETFGWYYVATAAIVVVFVLVIALSRTGEVRLGPADSRPTFTLFTWSAMLFAAGIGVDLMFFATAGPAANLLTPPDHPPMSDEATRFAALWTIFHYGIPGWAMYALMGAAVGLFAYRYRLPLAVRSVLAPMIGRRLYGTAGHVSEIAATVGTIFGIAVSLGIGVVFLNAGLHLVFGVPVTTGVQIALMSLAVGIAIVSTVSGVERGIRRLSELNLVFAGLILAWILFTGQTTRLLGALVQNVGDSFSQLPGMLTNTFAYTAGSPDYPSQQWLADWTLFFWAWWIAWAPFVSLFLARISRGRTLRQFILGVLLLPFGFIVLWVSIVGNAGLFLFRDGDIALLHLAAEAPEDGFFAILQHLPGASVLIVLALVTGLLFYVTSADSGSFVMAEMTSKPTLAGQEASPWLRVFWALATALLTLSMLFIDGVYTLQAATVVVGLPLSLLLYAVMIGLWRVLQAERTGLDTGTVVLPPTLVEAMEVSTSRHP